MNQAPAFVLQACGYPTVITIEGVECEDMDAYVNSIVQKVVQVHSKAWSTLHVLLVLCEYSYFHALHVPH